MNFKLVLIGLLLVLFSTQVYADTTPPVTTFSSFQVEGTTDQKLRKRFPELIGTQHKMRQMIQETQQDAETGTSVECFL